MHFGEYELFPSLIGLSPLPTGHPKTFQRQRVRSSTMCYHSFNLPMGRSHGFASATTNYSALFRLAFAPAPPLKGLTSLATATRRLIMQKARRHCASTAPTACKRMVSGSLSLPCSGFFSPFPHGTGSLSVSQEYLALADGPARFTQGFTCPALLRIPLSITLTYPYGTITPCGPTFQMVPVHYASNVVVLQPHCCRNNNGLGSSAFARHYSQNHYCFLLLRLLRCFSSPGLLPFRDTIPSV